MFPSAPPPKHHVQFALILSVRFTPPAPPACPPKSPSLIYLQIAKSDLPSNHLYDLHPHPPEIAKSDLPSNRLYNLPPPQNCQVRFTFKSPSPIYPQIVCTIYPPKIAKSDLPSNSQLWFTLKSSVWFTPPQIAKSDLPSNHQLRFTLKSPVRFTPPPPWTPLKSPSPIYPQIANCNLPSNRLYNLPPPEIAKSDLPSNHQLRFTLKSSVRFIPLPPEPPWNRQVWFTLKSPTAIYPQIVCMIYPPQKIGKSNLPSNHQVWFTLKLPVWFTPPQKLPSPIYPQIAKSDLPSNHLYDLPPLPLPLNWQVHFTIIFIIIYNHFYTFLNKIN